MIINSFLSEIEHISTDMKKMLCSTRHLRKQTSSTRIEIAVIKAEIDLTETLQKMSPEQLNLFYKLREEDKPPVVKSLIELNRQKSELEQKLNIQLHLLQQKLK
ncbi:hypothetical protein ACFFUS_10665 [Vibrio gallaecicus]|uniref:hypothetical protein n=1 Tax=Vibrio gallaecicus TaxID=552386 RepID=UPI0010C9A5C2|nr:hypothetical protein [Vibrio gallaecicus]MDN3616736.1 hypothetical protein [Vibrio gallaecicus]